MDLWRRLTNQGSSVPGQADTSSRCVAESVSGTHDLVVANYSLIRDLPIGDRLCSDTFSVGGHDWYICFHPRGSVETFLMDQYQDYAAASVHLLKRDKVVRLPTARVAIGLVDCHGTLANTTSSDAHFYAVEMPQTFDKFVRRSELTPRLYLKDDCLTIRCVLTVITHRREHTRPGPAAMPQLPDLHGHLERMLRDGKGTDVTIHVRGQAFRAHRCVLAARSPVFDGELFGPMKRKDTESIGIEDMEPMVFELLLHFIYTDSLPDDNGEAYGTTAVMQHLLVAADRYGVDKLKQVCDMKLRTSLDVETVATTLALAEQHHCPLLREACVTFMASSRKVLADIVATDGFKHLTASIPLENLSDSLRKQGASLSKV
uniref:Uncharacterized protein n=1 Tax=Avena sativa TaxID=4498 RepID=A0ACD5V197_AVESA